MTLVIGHRGFSSRAAENSMRSFELAIEAGADFVECDVRLSSDGIPVVIHDDTLSRTTAGKGRVGDRTAAELTALGLLRLDDILALSDRVKLAIELKHDGLEEAIVSRIASRKIEPDRVVIFGWTLVALNEVGRLNPELPRLLLMEPAPTAEDHRKAIVEVSLQAGLTHLGPKDEGLDRRFFELAHEAGLSVFVWTVNAAEDMRRLIDVGADGVITDHPDILLDVIGASTPGQAR